MIAYTYLQIETKGGSLMKDVKSVVKKMEVLVKVNTNGSERSSC